MIREMVTIGVLGRGVCATLCLCMLGTLALAAEPAAQWPGLRGPHSDGSAAARGVAAQWSAEEGLLWSTPLPGAGSSTPVVWGQQVFLTAAAANGDLLALCLATADGRVEWQHTHGRNRRQGRNDMTSPSAVTDGRRVIFLFGTGELAAYAVDGSPLWTLSLAEKYGALSWIFGYGASPLLYGERLYVQMMRRPAERDAAEGAFLLALDPATGKELWRQGRTADSLEESWESYVTPVAHGHGDGAQIILAGADTVTAHDPATGRELWRRDFNERRQRNWRLVPTPVSDGKRLFLALPRGVSLVGVEPDGKSGGLAELALWTVEANAPDVCSPLLYDGRLYLLDGDRRVVTCLDPASGRQIWRGELGGKTVIRSSPTAADGKIFFMDEDGLVYVLAAGDEFRVISRIAMGGGQPARSSIAIADGRLYVRTAASLHCVAPVGTPDD